MLTCHFEKSTIVVLQSLGVDFDDLGLTTPSDLLSLLRKHVVKQPNIAVSRKHFRSRVQEQGECFDDFLRNLRILARDCEFTDCPTELETALKEQVLMGVRSLRAQERILELPFKKTPLSKLVEVCRVAEQASRDAKFGRVQVQGASGQIRQVLGRPPAGAAGARVGSGTGSGQPTLRPGTRAASSLTCWNCAGQHAARDCDKPKAKCTKCNRDHLTRFCEAIQKFFAARVRLALAAEEEDEPAQPEPEDVAELPGDAQQYDGQDYDFGDLEDMVEDVGVHGVHAYSVRAELNMQEESSTTAQPVSSSEQTGVAEAEPTVGVVHSVADEDLDWSALPWTTPGAQRVWSLVTGRRGRTAPDEGTTCKRKTQGKKKKTDKRAKPP